MEKVSNPAPPGAVERGAASRGVSLRRANVRSDTRAHLAALEAHLTGRFEMVLDDAGLTVIAPVDPLGFRLTTMVMCRARSDDGGRLWFLTDEGEPLAEADRVIDAAVAITVLLRPLP